jgi:autotransporter-associated beta strand protein
VPSPPLSEFYWVGAGGTYQTLDCTVSAPESGSFTKEGAGDFTFQAANTYGGETVLKGGVLRLGAEGALPEGTVVAYEGGALEAGAETFPAELKVRIPGAENGTVRSCTLVTFTNSLPASLPSVEVVNAPAGERPCWVAMFSGLTLRTVRQRGIVVTFR